MLGGLDKSTLQRCGLQELLRAEVEIKRVIQTGRRYVYRESTWLLATPVLPVQGNTSGQV